MLDPAMQLLGGLFYGMAVALMALLRLWEALSSWFRRPPFLAHAPLGPPVPVQLLQVR